MKRELWRIEDVTAGLSASKANYKITIDSVQNPGKQKGKLDLLTVDNKKKKSTRVCKLA